MNKEAFVQEIERLRREKASLQLSKIIYEALAECHNLHETLVILHSLIMDFYGGYSIRIFLHSQSNWQEGLGDGSLIDCCEADLELIGRFDRENVQVEISQDKMDDFLGVSASQDIKHANLIIPLKQEGPFGFIFIEKVLLMSEEIREGFIRFCNLVANLLKLQLDFHNRISDALNEKAQIFQALPNPLYLVGRSGKIMYINRAALQFFHRTEEELVGTDYNNLSHDKQFLKENRAIRIEVHMNGFAFREMWVKCGRDERFCAVFAVSFMGYEDPDMLLVTIQDRTDSKIYEEKLQKSLDDKNALIRELHHRVKNNLQIIASMIDLQTMSSDSEEVFAELTKTKQRIYSIASIHELLYRSGSSAKLRMDEYIEDITRSVLQAFQNLQKKIDVVYDLEPIELELDKAVCCGIWLNEILTNAVKHAFSGTQQCRIYISIKQTGIEPQAITLSVSDNGNGLTEAALLKKGLGFTIAEVISKQIGGTYSTENRNGLHSSLQFTG